MDIHAMGAALLKIEELELDEEEGSRFSKRIEDLLKLYPHKVVNQKAMAWAALVATAGGIYGPRIGAYKLRKENEKATKPTIHAVNQTKQQPQAPPEPQRNMAANGAHPEANFPTPSQFWPESAEV